jgi:hypothetical protein
MKSEILAQPVLHYTTQYIEMPRRSNFTICENVTLSSPVTHNTHRYVSTHFPET